MTVSIRIPGWITNGTIRVPADTTQAMADDAARADRGVPVTT